jgi:hypothetical protein
VANKVDVTGTKTWCPIFLRNLKIGMHRSGGGTGTSVSLLVGQTSNHFIRGNFLNLFLPLFRFLEARIKCKSCDKFLSN